MVGDGIIDSGIQFDILPSQDNDVTWAANADDTGTLSAGPHQSQPKAEVTLPGNVLTADMAVTVNGTGTNVGGGNGGGVGGVSTGPGDAVVLALISSAIVTLLYTAYTRSPSFRKKEIEGIAKQHDPMDFRS
jgi:hypothetical protein